MKCSRFIALALAALTALVLPFSTSAQSDWPNKAITFIVPYPPGGLNDAIVRVIGERMSAELGKPVLIDNKAGAATTVASNFVAQAAPDGYTLYGGGTSLIINPTLQGNVQYDPHKSFDLVSLISFTPFILQVNADFPAKTMPELIAYLKANPGKFNMATSGIGATNHMAAEMFRARTGLKYTIVPYRGGAQAGQDVASGQAQMMFSASLEAKPFLASGKTRPIAISSLKRSPAFLAIPTVVEGTVRIMETYRDDLAGVIVEAQCRLIDPKPGFLEGLREATRRLGALLIFDEVVTGFRLAYGGAQELYGVTPDLACYGKIVGGGYPLAAVAGKRDLMELSNPRKKGAPDYTYISGTLNGNAVGATAGLATIAELEKPGAYDRLRAVGERMRAGLRDIAKRLGMPAQVAGAGPLANIYFTSTPITDYRTAMQADGRITQQLTKEMLKRGVMANFSAKMYISLVHSDADIDQTLQAVEDSLVAIRKG